jgi:hypothetical protein
MTTGRGRPILLKKSVFRTAHIGIVEDAAFARCYVKSELEAPLESQDFNLKRALICRENHDGLFQQNRSLADSQVFFLVTTGRKRSAAFHPARTGAPGRVDNVYLSTSFCSRQQWLICSLAVVCGQAFWQRVAEQPMQ